MNLDHADIILDVARELNGVASILDLFAAKYREEYYGGASFSFLCSSLDHMAEELRGVCEK